MPSLESSFSAETKALFDRLTIQVARGSLGHALLFYGSSFRGLASCLQRLTQMILCQHPERAPCGDCQACRLVLLGQHPDITMIAPEKKRSNIKIESIRALNDVVYTTPQLSARRVVLIQSADRMNQASANALLKLLEEPPGAVYFILQANQLNTLLPTILSRCQLWRVTLQDQNDQSMDHFLQVAADDDPDIAKLIAQLPDMILDLERFLIQKQQGCAIAAKWAAFDLTEVAMLLYWINASMIYQQMGVSQKQVGTLFQVQWPIIPLFILFQQMDSLNQLVKKLNQGISMNALLTIEHFLLGYLEELSHAG